MIRKYQRKPQALQEGPRRTEHSSHGIVERRPPVVIEIHDVQPLFFEVVHQAAVVEVGRDPARPPEVGVQIEDNVQRLQHFAARQHSKTLEGGTGIVSPSSLRYSTGVCSICSTRSSAKFLGARPFDAESVANALSSNDRGLPACSDGDGRSSFGLARHAGHDAARG